MRKAMHKNKWTVGSCQLIKTTQCVVGGWINVDEFAIYPLKPLTNKEMCLVDQWTSEISQSNTSAYLSQGLIVSSSKSLAQ